MEVHHHPKVDSDSHRKKHFKEYFLEFIMIFLAVTMGFFAENIREKITDNVKESEYMESVVQDLKSDTTELTSAIAGWSRSISNSDSILIYLKNDLSPSTINVLYNLLNHNFFHFNLIKYNDKTIQELKSSGDFRLIRSRKIAQSIMAFDEDMKYLLMQEQDVKNFMTDSKKSESKVFDFSQLNGDKSLITKGKLLNSDKQIIDEYYNSLYTFNRLAKYHIYLYKEDKKEATMLIALIQKYYL
jgi:hypothetical protein